MSNPKISFKILHRQYESLAKLINGQTMFTLSDDEVLRFQDVLNLLEERGYLGKAELSNSCFYKVLGTLTDFENWLSLQEKEEKRLSRREWGIAIISALVGSFLTLLPTIISTISSWLS